MIDKRGEIVEIIYNWQASPYSEKVLADRLMEWHESQLATLRKVWEEYSKEQDKSIPAVFMIEKLWQAINQVLGEPEEGGVG